MKPSSQRIAFAVFGSLAIAAASLHAETRESSVIAIKTDDFELAETDVSNLEIGEAKTIVTESGSTVDILRTADGFDIYVDGEQLEMPHLLDGGSAIHRHKIVVECVADGEEPASCEDDAVFVPEGDWDVESLHEEGHGKVIVKRINSECVSEDGEKCSDINVWFGDDLEFGELHESDPHFEGDGNWDIEVLADGEDNHKVIRIHGGHGDAADTDVEKDVIVVRKKEIRRDE